MGKKVFISYSHRQGDWVWNRLRPCLGAGGAEVVIDRERFQAGRTVGGQMDAEQDAADLSVAVLSTDYVRSELCLHELDRAAARDPRFECGLLVPVVREDCTLPPVLAGAGGPLWIDLRDDGRPEPWGQLFRASGGDLGCSAVDWLRARDQLLRLLSRRDSSNLIVRGKVAWRQLLDHLKLDHLPALHVVDLQDPKTSSRRGLVAEVLGACGLRQPVPDPPEDLVTLARALEGSQAPPIVALTHFDIAAWRYDSYELDLFSSLRYLAGEARRLCLLIQSRRPFAEILPRDHPLSSMTSLQLVELNDAP